MISRISNWFDTYRTPMIQVGGWFCIRIKQLFLWFAGLSSVVLLHINLFHMGEKWNDRVIVICLVLMALNHSVVETK